MFVAGLTTILAQPCAGSGDASYQLKRNLKRIAHEHCNNNVLISIEFGDCRVRQGVTCCGQRLEPAPSTL